MAEASFAEHFANDWIDSRNAHDLSRITQTTSSWSHQ